MSKFLMMLVALLAMGMFVFTACGDEDEDGKDTSGGDADTDGDGDTDQGGSDNGGGGDPFEGLDCAATDTMSCDYMICAVKSAYDQIAAMDCSTMQSYCDGVAECYATYVTCMTDVCPAGETYDAASADAMTACSTEVSTCASSVSMSK